MKIQQFTFNPFQENTYLVYNDSNEALIIDPGCYNNEEEDELKAFIQYRKLCVRLLVNTHLHIDHIFGNAFIVLNYHVKPMANIEDEFLLQNIKSQAQMFGVALRRPVPPIGKYIQEGDHILFGNETFEIHQVPGHSPGSIILYNACSHCVFVGDVLFRYSIGRTDLQRGDYASLIKGIKEKLLNLPEDTIVYSGHGPSTTIGEEKANNPFI